MFTEKDEHERFRAALAAPLPTPTPVEEQGGYLDAVFASRKSEAEVRSHFEAVWMRSCGQSLTSLKTKAELLLERVRALAAEAAPVQEQRRARIRHVTVDSKGAARWNAATVFDLAVPLAQVVGLLLVGWFTAMATLEEASDLYRAFDSWTNRATFTLLPALGLCAGWKMLGGRVAHAKRNAYWAGVKTFGIALACLWVVLFGYTMGGAAWEPSGSKGGGGLVDGASSSGGQGLSLGIALVITGILAETLLAAAAWNRFESKLRAVFPYEVIEDPLAVSQDSWIGDLEERRRQAKALHGEYLGEIERLENARTAYADEGVAALAPTWSSPHSKKAPRASSTDSIPSAVSGDRQNGNFVPGMETI